MADTVNSRLKRRIGWRQILRFGLGLLGLFCCYRLILDSATAGVSRLYSTAAILQSRVEPVDTAIRLTPDDPEAHYTRALALINVQRLDDAVLELRESIRLRPHHYYQWLDLGLTLDRVGDRPGAEAALRKSISLAPSFAQPHWQLGNMLYRDAQYTEAFKELRQGSTSNPNLTQSLFRLAWVAANGDVSAFLSIAQPNIRRSHLEAAQFLATQGKGEASVEQVREAGEVTSDEERGLVKQTIRLLLSAQEFSAAFEAWKLSHSALAKNIEKEQIVNGDFLDPILLDDPGFGWQLQSNPAVSVAIDTYGPDPGTRSLRIEYAGDISPSTPLVSQLVLLQPGRRYSLSFMAKPDNLVSGGRPVVVALATNSNPPKILGESGPLAVGGDGWSRYTFQFATDEVNSAIFVSIQRQQCAQVPCPIFGKLWLSKFSIIRATQNEITNTLKR
jgi:hypothetical protein